MDLLLAIQAQRTPKQSATDAFYASGCFLYERDNPRDAAKVFRAMMYCAPNDERGWLGLGACHEKLEQLAMAVDLYQKGARLARSVRCLLAEARVRRALGDTDGADEALARAEAALRAMGGGDEAVESLAEVERRVSCRSH